MCIATPPPDIASGSYVFASGTQSFAKPTRSFAMATQWFAMVIQSFVFDDFECVRPDLCFALGFWGFAERDLFAVFTTEGTDGGLHGGHGVFPAKAQRVLFF